MIDRFYNTSNLKEIVINQLKEDLKRALFNSLIKSYQSV